MGKTQVPSLAKQSLETEQNFVVLMLQWPEAQLPSNEQKKLGLFWQCPGQSVSAKQLFPKPEHTPGRHEPCWHESKAVHFSPTLCSGAHCPIEGSQ